MIQGVIFDLGSTLIRFEGDWQGAIARGQKVLAEALLEMGVELEAPAFLTALASALESSGKARELDDIERPTIDVVQGVLAQLGHTRVEDHVLRRGVESMYGSSEVHWSPMPGLHAVLGELERDGYRLGLISNAGDDPNVQRLIDNAGIRHYFDPILVSAAVGIRKPHPAIFDILLQSWRLPAGRVVMVGDTLRADILGAQQKGMKTIWLNEGADRAGNLESLVEIVPDEVARTLAEVPGIVHRMDAGTRKDARHLS